MERSFSVLGRDFQPTAMATNYLWYFVPLLIAVSLVYAGTRQETMPFILRHAVRTGTWIIIFMGIIAVILQVLDAFT